MRARYDDPEQAPRGSDERRRLAAEQGSVALVQRCRDDLGHRRAPAGGVRPPGRGERGHERLGERTPS